MLSPTQNPLDSLNRATTLRNETIVVGSFYCFCVFVGVSCAVCYLLYSTGMGIEAWSIEKAGVPAAIEAWLTTLGLAGTTHGAVFLAVLLISSRSFPTRKGLVSITRCALAGLFSGMASAAAIAMSDSFLAFAATLIVPVITGWLATPRRHPG